MSGPDIRALARSDEAELLRMWRALWPYVEGWYVDPDRRRRGLGRALVEAAARWGCGQGASESQRAHAALGFEEVGRSVHSRRPLAGNPDGASGVDEP